MPVVRLLYLSFLDYASSSSAAAVSFPKPTTELAGPTVTKVANVLSSNGIIAPTIFLKDVTSASTSSSSSNTTTVLATTSGTSTWSETFVETSLSQFATVTAPTTFTTTDTSGNLAVGIAYAGGLAWLGIPAGLPPITPPVNLPEPTVRPPKTAPEPSTKKQTTSKTSSSSSSSSSSTSSAPAVSAVFQLVHTDADAMAAALKSARIVPNNQITCAPDNPGSTVDRNQALGQLLKFCESQNGKKIDGSTANSQELDMGAGIVLQASLAVDKACSGTAVTSSNATCAFFFQELLDNCDTKSLQKHGGSVSDRCTTYVAQVVEHQGTNLTCNKPSSPDTGILRDNAISNIQAFCKQNSGSKVSPGSGNTFEFGQTVGNDETILSVTYSDSCTRQGSPTYEIDETACNRFLNQTIDGCDTGTTTAKFGGNITDHCGVFSFDTRLVESIHCGNTTLIPPLVSPMVFSLTDAKAAIAEFCDQDNTLDPGVVAPADGSNPSSAPKGTSFENYHDDTAHLRLKLQAVFAADQTGCLDKPAAFSAKGDECIRKLTGIVNSCDKQSITQKNGGLLLDNTSHGCVEWSIYGSCTSNVDCGPA